METLKNRVTIGGLIVIVLLSVLVYSQFNREAEEANMGSVQQSSEYHSTFYSPSSGAAQVIKTKKGTLGSVVITGAGAGYADLYDSTTTNATLRAITATGSLPTIAQLPANLAAGTYTYDANFYDGLLVVWTGAIATNTITWR